MTAGVARVASWLLLVPIWGYRRFISPLLPPSCRYYPSCAAYAEQAVRVHGPVTGSWLAVRRLGRCHPWTPGGVDHVPHKAPRDAMTSPSTLTGA